MQKGIQNDIVVMDFAETFDKVAHNRLLDKLSLYGVKRNTLGWVIYFLFFSSCTFWCSSGLGSWASLISHFYINDLPEHVTNSTVIFADDTLLY